METTLTTYDVAIIGAGPAGLSAAIELGEQGIAAVVFDEKPEAGGQLFKQIHKFFGSERHHAGVRGFEIGRALLARCQSLGIPIHLRTAVWGIFPDKTIGAVRGNRSCNVKAHSIIVATGAAENPLAFPGWTLPGIMGAGAAQTLVNYHRVRPGRRALVVGAGNVGLIVAYQLIQAGIAVSAVVEGLPQVGGYMVHAAKIRRLGVPIYVNHTVVWAEGDDAVRQCTIAKVDSRFKPVPGTEKKMTVDLVCIAVGLAPAVELCRAAGAGLDYIPEFGGWIPLHNESLMTTVSGLFVAGDVSGVEEASSAMEEGKLAAVAAAEFTSRIPVQRARARKREIEANLVLLRRGPFGRLIARKKREIHARYRR